VRGMDAPLFIAGWRHGRGVTHAMVVGEREPCGRCGRCLFGVLLRDTCEAKKQPATAVALCRAVVFKLDDFCNIVVGGDECHDEVTCKNCLRRRLAD